MKLHCSYDVHTPSLTVSSLAIKVEFESDALNAKVDKLISSYYVTRLRTYIYEDVSFK